jgi:hypothetical protein
MGLLAARTRMLSALHSRALPQSIIISLNKVKQVIFKSKMLTGFVQIRAYIQYYRISVLLIFLQLNNSTNKLANQLEITNKLTENPPAFAKPTTIKYK